MKNRKTQLITLLLFTNFICFSNRVDAVKPNCNTPQKELGIKLNKTQKEQKRLEKIINKKIQKRIAKQQASRKKANQNTRKKKKGWALASLLCGTVGLFIPFLGSIAAVVLGIIALKKIKEQPDVYGGKTMAILGIIFGVLYTFLLYNYFTA